MSGKLKLTFGAQKEVKPRLSMEGIGMNPFEAMEKISLTTVFFGAIVLTLAALMTKVIEPIHRIELGVIALVFLNLFFYSLIMDKISEKDGGNNEEV